MVVRVELTTKNFGRYYKEVVDEQDHQPKRAETANKSHYKSMMKAQKSLGVRSDLSRARD